MQRTSRLVIAAVSIGLLSPATRCVAADAPDGRAEVLTPPAPATPRVNGPRVYGERPGKPFLYTAPATGEEPIAFSAEGLPEGLILDAHTGRISGSVKNAGTYAVTLHASNARGTDAKPLKVVIGDQLCLTPPLGWNSWNCFAGAVDDAKVRSAADAMVKSGLAKHGWAYVNIDDTWEMQAPKGAPPTDAPGRDKDGMILANKKFPDMKDLCDYVHGQGLKIGIYSSPGRMTCAGFPSSYKFEDNDAKRYAEWGFDYLKYDWCSYETIAQQLKKERYAEADADAGGDKKKLAALKKAIDLELYKEPYRVMQASLGKADRDIVYSLCQYGMGDVWNWGAEVNGNCWRTTGDITDDWNSMSGIGFSQNGHEVGAAPGHWNDPDMLVVGQVGWGHLHTTHLTPDEQYTHISLWSLLSAPLLIGCDMTRMDDLTLGLLSNDEVLAVDQDELGRQAVRVKQDGGAEVWMKPLADGSAAVGLFNRGRFAAKGANNTWAVKDCVTGEETPAANRKDAEAKAIHKSLTAEASHVTVQWSELAAKAEEMKQKMQWPEVKLNGPQTVRDLWRQKDIGTEADHFTADVNPHGVMLVRVIPVGK